MASANDLRRKRAKRILGRPIEYTPSDSFGKQVTLPSFDTFDNNRVISADEEFAMFLTLNLAKFRASKLRKKLCPDAPCDRLMGEIEELLARADMIRNKLLRVFMKLGISVAKGFASSQFPLDELTSEASMTLFRALEKFDCDRGFRFSTYATHAIRRNLVRYLTKRRKERADVASGTQLDVFPEKRKWSWAYERRITQATSVLNGMMYKLEPRDQFILKSRFGLGEVQNSQTLQTIADSLGVSRERVRQLEVRATKRLRALAHENSFEMLDA